MEQIHISPDTQLVNNDFTTTEILSYLEDVTSSSEEPILHNSNNSIAYKYLSEVVDVDSLINSPLTEEQKKQDNIRVYLIKSAMGSGKTKVITDLTNKYNAEGIPVGHMMVYKKNIQDITDSTETVEYVKIFTDKAIKAGLSEPHKHSHIQTYTKRFFDVFAEGLIESGLETIPTEGYDTLKIIDHYFQDKVIFVDECDYMINMLAAFTSSIMKSHRGNKTWEYRNNLLQEAAKQFYLEVAKKCKALVLFTATTTSDFMKLLPTSTFVIDPSDYLNKGEAIKSISISTVTYVPFVEWHYSDKLGYLSDQIILDIGRRFQWNKALQFSPNIRARHIEHFIGNYEVGVLAPPHKLNKEAKALCVPTKETVATIAIANNSKTAVLIDISDFDTNDDALISLHTALSNDFVEGVEVILITGSNARAANVTTFYDDVLVITDAPWNAEIIQALGRFRNARIHAYILDRTVSEQTYNSRRYAIGVTENEIRKTEGLAQRKKSDRERRSINWWKANSGSIYSYWADKQSPLGNSEEEAKRVNSLVQEIEDFDFTLGNSMTSFTISVDLKYCAPTFIPTSKGKSKRDSKETKRGKKIIEFLANNKKLTQIQLIQKWKETYPDENVISSASITKYNKILKEQQQ